MGLYGSKEKTDAKSVGEVDAHNGPTFEIIHLPSAGGSVGVMLAAFLLVGLTWFIVRRCKRSDSKQRVKKRFEEVRSERARYRGGGDVELGSSIPLMPLPPVISQPPIYPSPFAMPGPMFNMGYHPQAPAAIGYSPAPRKAAQRVARSSRFMEVDTSDDEGRPKAKAQPTEERPEGVADDDGARPSERYRWTKD